MGILTDIGLLTGGKISKSAREKFVDDVNFLLLNGFNGKIFGTIDLGVPDLQFEGASFLSEPFTLKPIETHQEKFPTFHKFFIDTLFEKTAQMLNLEGATPLAPAVFDPTIPFASLNLKSGIGLPQIIAFLPTIAVPPHPFDLFDVDLTDIELIAELTLKFPGVSIPSLPTIPELPGIPSLAPPAIIPPFPDIKITPPGLPNLPSVPPLHLPNLKVYNILDIIGCIFVAVVKTIVLIVTIKAMEMVGVLVEKAAIGLIGFVAAELLLNIMACLSGLNLKNALSFIAGFVVYLERVIGMICVDVVGMVLGSGMIVKGVASAVRLV